MLCIYNVFYDGWWKKHEESQRHAELLELRNTMATGREGSQPMITLFTARKSKEALSRNNEEDPPHTNPNFSEPSPSVFCDSNCVGMYNSKCGEHKN